MYYRGCAALVSSAQSDTTVRDAWATVRKIPERTDAVVGTRAQKKAGPVRGRRLFSVSELVEVVGVEPTCPRPLHTASTCIA